MDRFDTRRGKRVDPSTEGDAMRSAWRTSRSGLVAIGLFSVFINILKLATPLYVLQILDRVLSSRSLETLYMLTAITLIAIVSAVSLEVVRRRMLMHWGGWIERRFGPPLFVAGLIKDASDATTSQLVRDVGILRSFVAGQGLIAWLDIIWAPIFTGCVFLISPTLGYVVLIACLFALGLGITNEFLTRESRNATLQAGTDNREWVASAERNRETLGSLNAVRSYADVWRRSAFARLDESMQTSRVNLYFAAGMRLLRRFLHVGVLGIGVWLVVAEVLTIGPVIAAGVLGRTAYGLVQTAMLKWREMKLARSSYGRVKAALADAKDPRLSRPTESRPRALILEGISYRYPKQAKSVIRGLDMTVEPGEVLCVIGPSGSGKTTLSRLITGLVSPRSGSVRLGDLRVHSLQRNSADREIGYLPQDIALFPGTVRENIASMAMGDIDLVTEAARLAGIHKVILGLPQGYDTEIVDKEPLLSASQRKGIAMARALYGIPPLIVLDEPAPHLDTAAREALWSGITLLKARGTVIVWTTQRKAQGKIADKLIMLRKDRVVTVGTRDKIVRMLSPERASGSGRATTSGATAEGGYRKARKSTQRRRVPEAQVSLSHE